MKETVEVLISEQGIAKRIDEIAERVSKDFEGKTISLICVLKGGVMFMVDLAKKLKQTVEFDFLDISSYGNSTESSGIIKIDKDLENPITGKHVLLVEDIIDSGRTLAHLHRHLWAQGPAELKICTLLDKPDRRVDHSITPDYVGFVIPDEFVVGYGLDYAQRYRNLSYIGILRFNEE
ncbi:MAG: hypoxanthine phosphoribosyltransferase [Clostridiales bacterium]|nr:hypoxanthine phosphoribosyltransferase [Clostridiales bacterium]MDR2750588.1 hypoxanthine phosphoribosyltransferase [Clostridiales bacterium]